MCFKNHIRHRAVSYESEEIMPICVIILQNGLVCHKCKFITFFRVRTVHLADHLTAISLAITILEIYPCNAVERALDLVCWELPWKRWIGLQTNRKPGCASDPAKACKGRGLLAPCQELAKKSQYLWRILRVPQWVHWNAHTNLLTAWCTSWSYQ